MSNPIWWIVELKRKNSLPSHYAIYRSNGKNWIPKKWIEKVCKNLKEAEKKKIELIKEYKKLSAKPMTS